MSGGFTDRAPRAQTPYAQARQKVQVSRALFDNAQVGFINGSQMPLPNPDVRVIHSVPGSGAVRIPR